MKGRVQTINAFISVEQQKKIIEVRGAELGIDHTEIIAITDETQWKFKIFCEKA